MSSILRSSNQESSKSDKASGRRVLWAPRSPSSSVSSTNNAQQELTTAAAAIIGSLASVSGTSSASSSSSSSQPPSSLQQNIRNNQEVVEEEELISSKEIQKRKFTENAQSKMDNCISPNTLKIYLSKLKSIRKFFSQYFPEALDSDTNEIKVPIHLVAFFWVVSGRRRG